MLSVVRLKAELLRNLKVGSTLNFNRKWDCYSKSLSLIIAHNVIIVWEFNADMLKILKEY